MFKIIFLRHGIIELTRSYVLLFQSVLSIFIIGNNFEN